MVKSKDLFDDTTMSFGEHLEALRMHLWKAILGLVLVVIVTLYFGDRLVGVIREPVEKALQRQGIAANDSVGGFDFWKTVSAWFGGGTPAEGEAAPTNGANQSEDAAPVEVDEKTILVKIRPSELAGALHAHDPARYPRPAEIADEPLVSLRISAPEFRDFRQTTVDMHRPITLNVQEAFMMYMKVALVAGLIFASPWVFYQMWLFVAAGLYPHERRYVYIYMPVSIVLFLGGAAFCFYVALPVMLDFLLGFNRMLGLTAQIHMSEWVSFAITLPLMFGLSFQLPVVMLFLERISMVDRKSVV